MSQKCTCSTLDVRDHNHNDSGCQRVARAKCKFCDQELCWTCADFHSHSSFSKIQQPGVVPMRIHYALHTLWSKAVGQPDYVKSEWRELNDAIFASFATTTQRLTTENELLLEQRDVALEREEETARELNAELAQLSDVQGKLVEALRRAELLLRLVTIRQVIESDHATIEASGLNPWCINEGLATGKERLDTYFIREALALLDGEGEHPLAIFDAGFSAPLPKQKDEK